jgi:hypothetical protein
MTIVAKNYTVLRRKNYPSVGKRVSFLIHSCRFQEKRLSTALTEERLLHEAYQYLGEFFFL